VIDACAGDRGPTEKPPVSGSPRRRFAIRVVFLLVWLLPVAVPRLAFAQLVVVANAKSGVVSLNRDDVINIFLGRYRQLPSGIAALPIDLPADDPDRDSFYRLLVHWEPAQINSYWARLTFAGRTPRPHEVESAEYLLRFVAANKGGIGYLSRSQVDARVRIVFELGP
jgi:hypothetical protein